MENEILAKLNELNEKIEAVYASAEKTRKYLLISMWTTIIVLVLPLIIGIFVVPYFINSYLGALESLL